MIGGEIEMTRLEWIGATALRKLGFPQTVLASFCKKYPDSVRKTTSARQAARYIRIADFNAFVGGLDTTDNAQAHDAGRSPSTRG